jgi:hypothetical protein
MCIRAIVVAACCIALLPVGAAGQQVGGGVKGGLSLGDIPRFADELDVSEGNSSLLVGWAVGGFLASASRAASPCSLRSFTRRRA